MKPILTILLLLISFPASATGRIIYLFVIEKEKYEKIEQANDIEFESTIYLECIKDHQRHVKSCSGTIPLESTISVEYEQSKSGSGFCAITENGNQIFYKKFSWLDSEKPKPNMNENMGNGKYVCGYTLRTISDSPSVVELESKAD